MPDIKAPASAHRRTILKEDLTKSLAAQMQLAESEARLSSLLENTPDMIWSVDAQDFRLLFWNTAFATFSKDEYGCQLYVGMYTKEVLPPDLVERWNALFERARREGRFDLKYAIRSGKRVFHFSFNLVKRKGVAPTISIFARDITEASRAEEAILEAHRNLAQSQAQLSALVESTSDFIWSVDAEQFRLLTYNSQYAEYCEQGLGIRIAVGMAHHKMMAPERSKLWEGLYRRALREGKYRIELETAARHRLLDLHFTVLIDNSRVFGIAVFGRDVTVERRAQRELEQHRAEMARVQRISTMGQLAASLAHQLGQPLTAIQVNARVATRLLSAAPPPLPELRNILEDILADNRRAANVIAQLGTLLNVNKLEFASLSLNEVVANASEMLRSDAVIRQVEVEQHLADPLPPVRGDSVQLTQVLVNLMVNGLESMADSSPENKRLIVETRLAKDKSVEVCVTDNGPGLPSDHIGRLFEPFYTTKKAGLGMGLAVSRAILERHQGRLWAQNNPDGGATFFMSLPPL